LPLNTDWPTRNVATAETDPGSMLALYQHLLAIRHTHDALSLGTIALHRAEGDVLAYQRQGNDERLLIVLNLGNRTQHYDAPSWAGNYRVLLSTLDQDINCKPNDQSCSTVLTLLPNQGVILAPPSP
jgi:alpha-glucosidase